jgi:hypothetical protein
MSTSTAAARPALDLRTALDLRSATCLSLALSSGQEAGIWGGLTEDERRRLPGGRHLRPAAHR